ncbi:MAG: DUF1190 domain-containing protein [Pseudomonadota bacterium]|nr:DUF1190 domain-containing protein [Pseudomonadota bacterium]
MKRSANLKLTLMAAAMPAALVGCEPPQPTGAVVTSVENCVATASMTLEQCQAARVEAETKHAQVAPRFESAAECNQQFGECTAVQENGQNRWIPPMGGFLIGYALAGGLDRNRGAYGYAGGAPLYREYRTGDYVKPSGDVAANRPGTVTGARGSTATPARAITVSRSGFGSRSAARSSFGGGRGYGG